MARKHKTDLERIEAMVRHCDLINKYISSDGITRTTIYHNYMCLDAVAKRIESVGEEAYKLSDEFKVENNGVEWDFVEGMRHKLVHEYEDTNWDIVVNTAFEDIPNLKEYCLKLISNDSLQIL